MKKTIVELKRDSRMLDSLMDMLSEAAYKDDKPIFDALVAAWRQGHRADNPLEQALLRSLYKRVTVPGIGNARIDVPHAAMAHMIRAMYPGVGGEAKADLALDMDALPDEVCIMNPDEDNIEAINLAIRILSALDANKDKAANITKSLHICYAHGPMGDCQTCPYYDDYGDCQSRSRAKDIVDLLTQVYLQGGDTNVQT